MAATKIRVTYEDGETIEIAQKPKAAIAAERKFGGNAFEDHPVEAGFYTAWFTLGMPGGPDGFDKWLDTVDAIERVEDPTEAASS